MAHRSRLKPVGRVDPGAGRPRTLASRPRGPAPRPERRPRFRTLDASRTRRDAIRGSRPRCGCRTALPRRAYRRTLAAYRSEELRATLEQLPDWPRRLRRVATHLPG